MAVAMIVVLVITDNPTEAELEQERQDRIQGLHCLSGLDGHHFEFKKQVIVNLNDPGSFRSVQTRISTVDKMIDSPSYGQHIIFMEFTAKNAFGGRVSNTARGTVNPDTCEAALLEIF